MTRSHDYPTSNARDAASMIEDAVTSISNRGHTREHALRLAAQELGVQIRRASAMLYGDPVRVLDDELALIRSAYLRHLDAEANDLTVRSDRVRERLRRMRAGES